MELKIKGEEMDSKELGEYLDNKFEQLAIERKSLNTKLHAVIGEFEQSTKENTRAISLLEKNYGELKLIAQNTEKILTEHIQIINKTIESNHAEYKSFREAYSQSPAVTDWKVKCAEMENIKEDINKMGIKFSKTNDDQNKKIAQHEKWFYIGFGVLFAGQAIFKYLPAITEFVSSK